MIDATEVYGEYRGMMRDTYEWMKTLQADEDQKMIGIQWVNRIEDLELRQERGARGVE